MVPVMRARFALVAATLAAVTVFPGDPMAYVASGPTWSQPQTPYYVNSANLDLPGLSAETALRVRRRRMAAADWPRFASRTAAPAPRPPRRTTGSIWCCFATRRAVRRSPRHTGGPAARGSSTPTSCSGMERSGSSPVRAAAQGGFYIEDIAAHEFGHALGLGHSTSTSATMYPSVSSCSAGNRTLDADDIAGARALYPLPPPPRRHPDSDRFVRSRRRTVRSCRDTRARCTSIRPPRTLSESHLPSHPVRP